MHIHTIPLNIEKLLGGTSHMDATEFGAYMSLIVAAYQSGNKLPNDDKRLARMARVTGHKWGRIKNVVLEKFELKNETYEQKYVKISLQRMESLSKKNSANALGNKDTAEPVASQPLSQNDANTSIKYQVSKIDKEERKKDIVTPLTDPQSIYIEAAVEIYNEMAEQKNIPKCQKLSEPRKAKLKARLKDCGGIQGWETACNKISNSSFLTGGNEKGWSVKFDWIIKQENFIKIMEGNYDDRENKTNPKLGTAEYNAQRLQEWVDG